MSLGPRVPKGAKKVPEQKAPIKVIQTSNESCTTPINPPTDLKQVFVTSQRITRLACTRWISMDRQGN